MPGTPPSAVDDQRTICLASTNYKRGGANRPPRPGRGSRFRAPAPGAAEPRLAQSENPDARTSRGFRHRRLSGRHPPGPSGPRGGIETETPTLAGLGAGERDRTAGLAFTRRLLCLLSYTGTEPARPGRLRPAADPGRPGPARGRPGAPAAAAARSRLRAGCMLADPRAGAGGGGLVQGDSRGD